ncbi:NAAT family transporter [Flavobacterium sp. XN-5]|uniref:MarC family protein n=1 Tax=Flavobacterium sp. XN-5 TaxID=2599390 RepID=UPI0011CBAEAC|nr:NAAT family transporter [Flavobacterium sp. XN-5]NGY37939.1 NAAT family transporter [Flavobacterium sp. XN-5]
MDDLITFGLLCLTSFFTLINPLGTMPIFLTMTTDLTEKERQVTAKKASLVSFIIIICFALSGQLLFKFFGISVNSFKIVGGVIFFMMGMDMLQARLSAVKIKKNEVKTYVNDISITPLAIPMICGPGAITNAIVLMEDATSISKIVILLVSIAAIVLTTYFVLLSSSKIIKVIGQTGINVMMRLMGLIVMVIAVEFFFSGLKPILHNLMQ